MSSIKERLIQVVLRGKDLLSPEAKKGKEALEALRSEGEKLRAELDKAKADSGLAKTLESLNKESARTERELDRARDDVEKLREALDKAPGSKGLETSLKAAEREARRAEKALEQVRQETVEMAAKAKAAGIDTTNLAQEEKRLAAELDRAKAAVNENGKATKQLQQEQAAAARSAAEQESRTKSLRDALSGTEKRVLAFAAAYISLNAAMGLVRKGIDLVAGGFRSVVSLGDAAEKTSIQLAGLMGGDEAGAAAGKWIEDFADRTGQRINEVTEAFVGLKSYGLDPMDGSLEAIMNKTAQMGGDAETLKGISLGLGQMWAKEKIVQEEVNQLRERGVMVFDLLANAMGKTTTQIQDMAAKGQLGRNEIKLLIDEIGKSADGQAAAALGTLSGMWNVMLNQFQKFGEKVASNGVLDILKEKLESLLGTVQGLMDDGTLDNLALALANAFGQGVEKIEELVGSLDQVDFRRLIDSSSEWLNDFGNKIDSVVTAGETAGRVMTGVWHGFRYLVTGMAWALMGVVNSTIGTLMKAGAAAADALGMDGVAEKMRHATGAMEAIQQGFADAMTESYEKVNAAINGATEATEDAAAEQKAALDKSLAQHQEWQAGVDAVLQAHREKTEQEAAKAAEALRQAAVDGTRAFEDIADAVKVIDTTDSVAELEKLRQSLLQAGKDGTLTQQELDAAVSKVSRKITDLGAASKDSAKDLTTLEGVMKAIKTAVNDLDVRQAKAALDKLYREGKIDADELKKAQEALNNKVADLKPAAETAKKSVDALADSNAQLSSQLRQTAASTDEAGAAAQGAGQAYDFFGAVLSQAREPLAQMSAAALEAFDAMQGINQAASAPIDTSSYMATVQSLESVRRSLSELRYEQERIFNPTNSFANWALDHIGKSQEIQLEYLGQKAALQQLMETVEKGGHSMSWLAGLAGTAASRFNLLSESDLSPLISQAKQARQAMQDFSDSTQNTVDSLRLELLQLRGTEEEIAVARAEQRRKELLDQIAIAQANRDDTSVARLQEALGLLAQIESEQVSRIRQDALDREEAARKQEEDARKREAEAAQREADSQAKQRDRELETKKPTKTTADSTLPTVGQQLPQGTKITRVVRIEGAKGSTVDMGIRSASDEIKLLQILEESGLRAM